jgi:hypothetical protein
MERSVAEPKAELLRGSGFRWIWPPRPEVSIRPESIGQMSGFVAQLKYNDWRTVTYVFPDGGVAFFNRQGGPLPPGRLTAQHERGVQALAPVRGKLHVLDGGSLRIRVPAFGSRLILWDILVWEGRHLVGTTYRERYGLLQRACGEPSRPERETGAGIALETRWPGIWLAPTYETGWTELYQSHVHLPEIEGLVLKDPAARLERALSERNNGSWQIRVRKPHANYAF